MRNNWKKVVILLLSFVLIIGLAACTKEVTTGTGTYKAGTYTAMAKGNNGDVKVEVVFDDNSIVSVKVLEHNETEGISDAPIERIPEIIVKDQTLAIDTISGATNTSNAILAAVEDCIKQAGGDIDSLKLAVSTEDTDKVDTELTTDVVVIGGGGTGLAAAASAHENGAKVIVLEKLATVGGSTALSGGGISATGTRFQEELGIEDSKESWMGLWKERQATSNPNGKYPDYDRVDTFMDEAIKTTHWLVDYVKHSYAKIEGFGFDPVPRLHFPEKGGADLMGNIEKFVSGEGIEILTETSATELITDENGDVVGVIADGISGKITIHAKKVILASGGFAKNEELLARLVPEMAGTSELSAASAGSTGDGILMAEKLGAALYEEPWVIGLGMGSKVQELGGIEWDSTKVLVNEKGERFMNESSHYAIVTNKVAEQEQVWMLIDSSEGNAKYTEALKGLLPNDEIAFGETIEELAESMGVSEANLVNTIKTFNEAAKNGNDSFAKPKEMIISVETGPYYAAKFYPKTMGTFGGVKTDENYRVIHEDGSIINNLYAGGECSNKILYNQVYMSGSAVQLALTSGRISGEHAAKAISK
jgi:fumarate reductase flavoprotein subunit